MKRPPNVPADAKLIDGDWHRGNVRLKKNADGSEEVVRIGRSMTWRNDGAHFTEWDGDHMVAQRAVHPNGALAYQATYLNGREHGVTVWQRSDGHDGPFPVNEPASTWRIEETYRHGKRIKVRKYTRRQWEADQPAKLQQPPWNVTDVKTFSEALTFLIAKPRPKPRPSLPAWASRHGLTLPVELVACVGALARAGFPDLNGWETSYLPTMLRLSMTKPILEGTSAFPLGMDGGGCAVVYLPAAHLSSRYRVGIVEKNDLALIPVASGLWDFARLCVVSECFDRGLLEHRWFAAARQSLRGKARALDGELADLPGLKPAR